MVVVSTRDFRTNQTKYLNLAKAGEHVVLKSRAGSFRIFPDDGSNTIDAPRDLMKELRNALTEVKEAIAGKRKPLSAEIVPYRAYLLKISLFVHFSEKKSEPGDGKKKLVVSRSRKVVQKSGPETRDAIIQLIANNANITLELTEYC